MASIMSAVLGNCVASCAALRHLAFRPAIQVLPGHAGAQAGVEPSLRLCV